MLQPLRETTFLTELVISPIHIGDSHLHGNHQMNVMFIFTGQEWAQQSISGDPKFCYQIIVFQKAEERVFPVVGGSRDCAAPFWNPESIEKGLIRLSISPPIVISPPGMSLLRKSISSPQANPFSFVIKGTNLNPHLLKWFAMLVLSGLMPPKAGWIFQSSRSCG